MIVRCDRIFDAQGLPVASSASLTVGASYPVIESTVGHGERAWFRIIDDRGESPLFSPALFSVVDDSVSVNWIRTAWANGSFVLGPARWAEPGFWKAFYDDDPAALNAYYDELAVILEPHPDWWDRAQIHPGRLISAERVEIAMDYGQFTISGGGEFDPLDLAEAAIEAPPSSDDGHSIVVLSPHQNNFAMPIDVEIWSGRPLDDRGDWEQVSEHALLVEEPGIVVSSPTLDEHRHPLASGEYLVEVSGRGFVAIGWPGTTTPNDTWRVRLWPRWGQRPRKAKIWSGPDATAARASDDRP